MSNTPLQRDVHQQSLEPGLVERDGIIALLSKIASEATPAALYAEWGDAHPLSVKIRRVTAQGFQLYARDDDPETCRRLEEGIGIFVGAQGRYKIQFQISRLHRLASPPGKNGLKQASGTYFECSFPEKIWSINRREEFRAIPAASTSLTCEVRPAGNRTVVAKAFDISAGGVCLELPEGLLDATIGTVWPDCTLRLDESRRVVACTLVVTTIEPLASPPAYVHIGCQLRLNKPSLSAAEFQMMNLDVQRGEQVGAAG